MSGEGAAVHVDALSREFDQFSFVKKIFAIPCKAVAYRV